MAGVLLLVGMSGCTLRQNVMWLPDSSGIVYPENGGHRISRYDLGTKKVETAIAETGIYCTNPALNREGTRLAVAKYEVSKIAATRELVTREQIVIFNLQGEEVQRLPVRETKSDIDQMNSEKPWYMKKMEVVDSTETLDLIVNWSGPENRLLAGTTLYNLQTGTWKELKVVPLPILGSLGMEQTTGPIEHGFLGVISNSQKSEQERLVFVNWEGEISEFRGAVPQIRAPEELISFVWEGRTAKYQTTSGMYEYDTERMICTFTPELASKTTRTTRDLKRSLKHEFPATSLILKLSSIEEKNASSQEQLVSIDPKTKVEAMLIPRGMLEEMRFYPAPDGRKVAVRGKSVKDDQQETIVIVDEGGKVLDQIPCAAGSGIKSWIFVGEDQDIEPIEKANKGQGVR